MWYESVVERLPSGPSINAVLQMRQITAVIAPEHNRIHHDHKNKLKNDEELLINQMSSHFKKFKGEFDNVAQGDWVKKTKNELDDISKKLKNIQRTEV